jgi:cysteine desulfurase
MDSAATTATRPEAIAAMLPFLSEHFANPSSPHARGQAARSALDELRERSAAAIGARSREIVFTGGGSESVSLAILGVMENGDARDGFVTAATEHHAVLHAADALARRGARVTVLRVDGRGLVDPDELRAAIDDRTKLVSIQHANNETGTIQPIAELARIAHDRGALFHTDAIQSAGKIAVDVDALGVDALSLSAHKFEGPKGVGALFVRDGVRLEPRVFGGAQERSLRAGTENVAGIAGAATALALAVQELPATEARVGALRDRLERDLLATIDGCSINAGSAPRLPGITSVRFSGCDGAAIVVALDVEGIDASTGSACTSGSLEPSHVLTAIGLDADAARSTVRISLSRTTTSDEVDVMLGLIPGIIERMRRFAAALAAGL